MSKYLIKILSICAFVILIPLIIVGSALCVTEAMACRLTIVQGGIEGGRGASSEIAIYIDNQKQEENRISIKKNTEVTVVFSSDSYDFVGWYNGSFEEIDREQDSIVSKDAVYTFIVRGNTTLTAMRDIKQYTITYDGLDDEGNPISVEPATRVYKYGEALEDLVPKTDLTFDGWYIIGSDDVTSYKNATFPASGTYTVNPAWSNQMVITYRTERAEDTTIIAQERVTQQGLMSYNLLTAEDSRVADYINEYKQGYKFKGWVDINNSLVNASDLVFSNAGVTLYISLDINSYSIVVKESAISDEVQTLTYNARDGFSAYNTEARRGYYFGGLIYNEGYYTFDSEKNDYFKDGVSLGTVLISENAFNTNAVAVWECIYPDVALYINGVAEYTDDLGSYTDYVFGKVGDQYIPLSNLQEIVMFEDKNGEKYFDVEDDIISLAFGKFDGIYRLDDNVYTLLKLATFDTVNVRVNNIDKYVSFSTKDKLSFYEVFSALEREGYDVSTIERLTFTFEFEIA